MLQKQFAENAASVLENDPTVIGLAVAGSWLTDEMDEFSDLDLLLVTQNKVAGDKDQMLTYARKLGDFLSGFTGEHVGEPRVLICLFDNPLLHVDIKFLTLDEFHTRIETPAILLDRDDQLRTALHNSSSRFPYPDYQWIEDRFWTWVHYALLKIGRGELVEAFDFFGYLRMVVFGPLLHIRNNNLPRGVRKVEVQLPAEDFALLKGTIPTYDKASLFQSLENAVALYRQLRKDLYTKEVTLQTTAEKKVMEYLAQLKQHADKVAADN